LSPYGKNRNIVRNYECPVFIIYNNNSFSTGICGLAVMFILASYSGCNQLQAILFFSFASGFAGLDNSRVNNMDLSPNYAPTIIAIVNSCGSIMGILAPMAVGFLTPNVS
jgi:MFS transporter, ACS family, solute carrier family 17 (sodium-dependent inorganic phosphate cotransporter), other